jgi:hypothetical protein
MASLHQGNWNTDGCTSQECTQTLSAASSLSQGQTFADFTKTFHGGRRSRKNNRKNRKMNRKMNRKQRGGMADFPGGFSETLPQDLHQSAMVQGQDAAFAALPQFVGKYGMSGGSRRRSRKHGGALHPAEVTAPTMILTKAEEPAAFLNPQWYTENQVVPSFQGPNNAYAAQATQQYANQADYKQAAGRRSRKASRKNRKASRKHRKASRKNRRNTRRN